MVDLDIMSFFDEIPHDLLMEKVRERITHGKVLTLIRGWLTAGVMEDDQFHETEVGSPQGGVISLLLTNLYLNHFDWRMKETGFAVVRYADDLSSFAKQRSRQKKPTTRQRPYWKRNCSCGCIRRKRKWSISTKGSASWGSTSGRLI
jgi:RNA-directed DNA polymerase